MKENNIAKKNNLMKGLIALSVLGLVSASALAASTTFAASGQSALKTNRFRGMMGQENNKQKTPLTDAQRQDLQAKQAAVRAALDAGDYNAWVTAVKALDANSKLLSEVTADNFNTYVTQHKQNVADKTTRQAKEQAVADALNSGNYDNWVAAVKAENANAPILTKINSTNFSRYSEAYKLKVQSDNIMKELGLNQGKDSFGFGNPGAGLGLGRGGMMGKGLGRGLNTEK